MRLAVALSALLLLTGCVGSPSLESLKATPPVEGDAYRAALVANYRDMAEGFAAKEQWDRATYFAEKGLSVVQGIDVVPEPLSVWKIGENLKPELTLAREKLMAAVPANRSTQPELAASALVAFDRWIVLESEATDADAIRVQREVFYALLTKLEEPHVASEAVEIPPPTVPAEARPEARRTVLYFPFDSARLGDSALKALAEFKDIIPDTDATHVAINGHADRAGPEEYNMKLSERRAKFVLKELEKAGIPAKRMEHFAFGETDPAVPTEDGVPEPKNRRVEIVVE